MSLLDLLPLWAKLAILAAIAAVLAGAGAMFVHHERDIGRADVQAKWDAAKVAQQQALIAAQSAAAAKTLALQQEKDEAVNAAAQREKKLRSDLAAARATGNGLRDDLAAARSDLSRASVTSLRAYTATLGAVFSECTAEVERLAAAAQGHASDALTLEQAWPK